MDFYRLYFGQADITWSESLQALYWNTLEYIKGWLQEANSSIFRRIPRRGRQRARGRLDRTSSYESAYSANGWETLPPLESMVERETVMPNLPLLDLSLDFDTSQLEPAFVESHEYPTGWRVYHPELGVVGKSEADNYGRHKHKARVVKVKSSRKEVRQNQAEAAVKEDGMERVGENGQHKDASSMKRRSLKESKSKSDAKVNNVPCQVQRNGGQSYSKLSVVAAGG
jgi:hypothetical protein